MDSLWNENSDQNKMGNLDRNVFQKIKNKQNGVKF